MAQEYNQAYEYNANDVQDFFLKPMKEVMLPQGITVHYTKGTKMDLFYLYLTDDDIYAPTDGFNGSETSTLGHITATTTEFEKETVIPLSRFKGMIKYRAEAEGLSANELEGSEMEELEIELFSQGALIGIIKNLWLGDKSKTHAGSGTYKNGKTYTAGSGDERYNRLDGVWTTIEASQGTANEVVLFDISSDIDANGLVADAAMKHMKKLLNDCADELYDQDKSVKRFYATKAYIQNYETSLETMDNAEGRKVIVDGIEYLTYKGVQIVPFPSAVEKAIKNDFGNENPHRLLLSGLTNIYVLFGLGKHTEAQIETDNKAKHRWGRLNFEADFGYLHPELMAAAWGAYVTP